MAYNSGTQSQYRANSDLASTGQAVNFAGVPKPASKPAKEDGTIATDLWRFLNSLASAPSDEVPIVLGGAASAGSITSTFQATANGAVLISGTVTGLSITRNNAYNLSTSTSYVPMSINDVLSMTYSTSAVPTATWFPK